MYAATMIDTKLIELEVTTVKDFTIMGSIPLACYRDFIHDSGASSKTNI